MRILISGASGLLGSAIRPALASAGHSPFALVRRAPAANEVPWDPASSLDPRRLEGFDGIVHLAGKNIAGRWTGDFKRQRRESRVQGTARLALAAAQCYRQTGMPRIFVMASAIGYYGDRGDEELTETSPPGRGFLAQVCQEWENASRPAADAGVRVVNFRVGAVLARHGGALRAMLPPFRLGLGGRIGDGRQYLSWITLDDVADAFRDALANAELRGPVNLVAPYPVRNAEFVRSLADTLHRPAIFPLPRLLVRVLLGEMGESLLLASARVQAIKLQGAGFRFQHPELRGALGTILGRS